MSTAPTLSSSRFSTRPMTPWGNSSISEATAFSRPWIRATPSPTCTTVPTSWMSDASLVALDAGLKDAGYLLRTQFQLNPPS